MSTVMTGYSNIPTFHPFPDHSNHVHQSAQQQQPSVNHSDPFAMMPHAGPSSQPIQYNQLPTASYPYQASSQPQPQPQPPQFTHSNSAPEIQYYEAPSVFAPPDPASNGFPQLQINHNPFPSSSGQMPAASYVSDYHFGDSPAMPHGSGVGMGQGLPNGYAGPPQGFRGGPLGPPEGDWDDDDTREIEMVYGNLEVKHRRRTTPDQLKVLEHWFAINPKPDNSLREWLASELGMTKRNVQVWFQNRRAKVKGLALKERDRRTQGGDDYRNGSESDHSAPPSATSITTPIVTPERQGPSLLPPAVMGRRVSIANGEAAHISLFIQKRQNGKAVYSPGRSPNGQVGNARRGSIPYPTPLLAPGYGSPNVNPLSPRASPVVRPMPSQLHLAAMRNNTRRASMPGAAQLISSGPFTPPRNVSGQAGQGVLSMGRVTRELSPIKDHCEDSNRSLYPETGFTTTFVTPPSSTYLPNGDSLPTDSTAQFSSPADGMPYTPFDPTSSTGPLPNPSFQFGQQTSQDGSHLGQGMLMGMNLTASTGGGMADDQIYMMMMQQRGRMGSIGSIGTYTTENGTEGSEWGGGDWLAGPDGFEPGSRRSSGPSDLLENLGLMGLTSLPPPSGQPLRPSPLGQTYPAESQAQSNGVNDGYPTSFSMSDSLSQPLSQPQFHNHSNSQSLSPNPPQVYSHTGTTGDTSPASVSNSNALVSNPGSQAGSRDNSTGPSPAITHSAPPVMASQSVVQNQYHGYSMSEQQSTYPHSALPALSVSQAQQNSHSQPQPPSRSQGQIPNPPQYHGQGHNQTRSQTPTQPQNQSWISPLNPLPQAPLPVRSASDTTTYSLPSLGYSSYTEGSGDGFLPGSATGSSSGFLGMARSTSAGTATSGGVNTGARQTQQDAFGTDPNGYQAQAQAEIQYQTTPNSAESSSTQDSQPRAMIGVGVGVGGGIGVGGRGIGVGTGGKRVGNGAESAETTPVKGSAAQAQSGKTNGNGQTRLKEEESDDLKEFELFGNFMSSNGSAGETVNVLI